jgi:hypothetical protein
VIDQTNPPTKASQAQKLLPLRQPNLGKSQFLAPSQRHLTFAINLAFAPFACGISQPYQEKRTLKVSDNNFKLQTLIPTNTHMEPVAGTNGATFLLHFTNVVAKASGPPNLD